VEWRHISSFPVQRKLPSLKRDLKNPTQACSGKFNIYAQISFPKTVRTWSFARLQVFDLLSYSVIVILILIVIVILILIVIQQY